MSDSGDPVPPADVFVDATFGEGGYLAQRFNGYKPRAGQVALAHAVDKAIAGRTHLMAEGPTGTGKSLAYAVPATYHAATSGKRVVIVTANIALQEQIFGKDLPLLADILPWRFTYALMKGRNNYLCIDKFKDEAMTAAARQRSLFANDGKPGIAFTRGDEITADERRHLPIVQAWAEEQVEVGVEGGASGDKSDLPLEPHEAVWRRFSVSADECKGQACDHVKECFSNAAMVYARSSQIVVTNYHLFFANLAIYADSGADRVLPAHDVAILDEAHAAANIARDFFGFKLTAESIKRVGSKMPRAESLARAARLLFGKFSAWKNTRELYNARIKEPFDQLHEFVEVAALLDEAVAHLHKNGNAIVDAGADGTLDARQMRKRMAENERALQRATKVRADLQRAGGLVGENAVYFLEEDEKGRVSLVSRLVRPGEALAVHLFAKTKNEYDLDGDLIIGPPVSVVCTSATLATGKGKGTFEFAADELGVETYDQIVAESPFDWTTQCMFVAPPMCEPNDPKFADEVAATFLRVIEMARGRTLGLFTSRRVLNHVFDRVTGRGFRVLKQGDAPRTKLIEEFKRDVSSVLLGNDSFWAGVDVPGEALSCVVIDRLPFPPPDDPVLDAMASRVKGGSKEIFFKHSIPRAIIAFKQGAGRLIRSTTDRGVIVCLDARLSTKGYGKQFLVALPPVPKSQRLDMVGEFLDEAEPDARFA